jgi:hypothetical protein
MQAQISGRCTTTKPHSLSEGVPARPVAHNRSVARREQ